MIMHPLDCLARKISLGFLLAFSMCPMVCFLHADEPAEWIWHDRWVTSFARGSDAKLYASLATGMPYREGSVVVFSNENPDDAIELYRQPAAVWAVATSPDKSTLASTDFQGSLAVTPLNGGETKHFDKAFAKWTRAVSFASDSKHLAAGNEAGTVFAWSIGEGKAIGSRDLASGQIMGMAFSPSGETLAVATGSGKLQLIKWPSLEAIKEIAVGNQPLWSVAYGSGNQLWVGSADGTVRRIPAEGDPIEIAKLNDWVTSLATLPGGGLVAVSMRGQVKRSSETDPKTLLDWAEGPKGAWGVIAISTDRIIVATRKLGPTVLQSVGQMQYVAKDLETKKADRKAAAEKAAAEKAAAEKAAEEKIAAEKLAAERAESEKKAEAEKKAAAEKAAADKAAADKAAADKAAADKAAADKAAADKAAADKAAVDKAAADKEADKPKADPK